MLKNWRKGFSLAELLIALAIMGVIAAVTIPPMFQVPAGKSNTKYSAIAKDTAFMVLSAYEQYKATNTAVSTNTSMSSLTPYMNYLRVDTSRVIDGERTQNTKTCGAGTLCLLLHNGAMLYWETGATFGGSDVTNTFGYWIDPDGVYTDGTTDGPGKSLVIFLQYNGVQHSWGTLPKTLYGGGGRSWNAYPSADPVWFTGF